MERLTTPELPNPLASPHAAPAVARASLRAAGKLALARMREEGFSRRQAAWGELLQQVEKAVRRDG
jgi:hypothetical protein